MILFPYRAQIKLHKLPVMTIAVSLLCLLIYVMQARSDRRVEMHAQSTCAALAAKDSDAAKGYPVRGRTVACDEAMLRIHYAPDREKFLSHIAEQMERAGDADGAERLRTQYRAFAARAPVALTPRLWHDRSRLDLVGMLTSSFAHGSWEHVIFNLIFFFAFAAAVELVLGPVLFLGTIVLLSYSIGLFDFTVSHLQGSAIPSLGLSGVVMGMLALFTYFLPRAKIRFFFWFALSVGTIGIPAWLVALLYIGGDLYSQLSGAGGYVNFIAHLAGAGFGFLVGVAIFRSKRHWAKELVLETVDLTRDESWLTKVNAVMVGPMVAGIAFLVALLVVVAIITFVRHFWVLLLLAAPAVAAGYQIYRSRKGGRPVRERYEVALEAVERHRFDDARKLLEPLAQQNDTRALFALAQMYAAGKGVVRDETKALALYTRAAERRHGPSLQVLGSMYADGRGAPRNPSKAREYYEKAAAAGMPDAANSLGYMLENGVGVPADKEKAIEWYYRAGVGYQKARRLDEASAVVRHLESMLAKYPAVLNLVTELKTLLATGKPKAQN